MNTLSKQRDSFRVSYGKRSQDFPRQCVFFGTTNNKFFLKDRTGNRRFFPITCSYEKRIKNIFLEEKNIDEEINQIWAEAYVAWKNGESIWVGHEMEQAAKKIQDLHTEENPLVGAIEEYLNKKIPLGWYERDLQRRIEFIRGIGDFDEETQETFQREKVCASEIWCELLGGDMKKLSPYEIHNITDSLLSLTDWEPSQEKLFFGSAYGRQKAFIRKKADENDDFDF